MKRIIQGLVLVCALSGVSGLGQANEFTDVIDAFDMEVNDPFDLNLSVGYERFQRSSTIRRERTVGANPHDWDFYDYQNMFEYKQVSHILNLNLEIGLYKDISLRFHLPLILNDTRKLSAHSDWDHTWRDTDDDGVGETLFALPFKSPERSGVDYFAVGLWWGILDQGRDDTKPNWTFFAEGRFGVGDTIQASCNANQDLPMRDADGNVTSRTCEEAGLSGKGGISRGVNELHFGTRLSRRYGIFDPYFGFDALIGWAKDGTAFFIEDNSAGQINTMPPVSGTLDFGMEIIPWEMPEKHIKFSINLGGYAKYHSEGREYTALFDALGTSPYFTDNAIDYNFDGDDDLEMTAATARDTWSGMTDVENYATFGGKLVLMIQPAKYVKFHIGTALAHETEHFITKTDQCSSGNLETVLTGGIITDECTSPNLGHRPEIDSPGNRFRAEKTLLWHFFIDAVAMF